jgi:hypothetical protein
MKYEEAVNLIKTDPARIGYYMGFDDFTPLHNKWLLEMLFDKKDQTKQAHRGSYKTSVDSLFIAINTIIRPWERLIFLRKTDDDVTEVIVQAQTMLKSGAMQEIALALHDSPLLLNKDTNSEIDTSYHTGVSGASQVRGFGIGASLTGKHADTIVTDDIVNIKDRISRAERERTKIMYMELQNVRNRGGRIINTGTPWHKDDAFTLMGDIDKYDCYTTGLMTEAQIMHLRNTMSPSLFSANYELKHIADEDALFTNAQFIKELPMDGICHIDAGYGGEDATAFTVIADNGGYFVVYGKKYQKHVDDCIDDILRLKAKYRAGTTWCEKNADKGYLAKELKNHGDLAQTYHEKMNKHIKISTYLKENWNKVYFTEATDPEYIAEILDYNEHAPHDDCPDSLASAIRQMGKKPMKLNRGVKTGI